MSSVFRLTFAFSNSLGRRTNGINRIRQTWTENVTLFARREGGRGNDTRVILKPRRERKLIPFKGREEGEGQSPSGKWGKPGRGSDSDRFLLRRYYSRLFGGRQQQKTLVSPYSSSRLVGTSLLKWKNHKSSLFSSSFPFLGPPQSFF